MAAMPLCGCAAMPLHACGGNAAAAMPRMWMHACSGNAAACGCWRQCRADYGGNAAAYIGGNAAVYVFPWVPPGPSWVPLASKKSLAFCPWPKKTI